MLGSGAAIFLAAGRNLLEVGLDVTRFFRNESCGKCVPCRVGTEKAVKLLESQPLTPELVEQLRALHETLARTSICGLGQIALAPLLSIVDLSGGDQRG
jgi:NADH:ubiquinone oxidoreductase subunit F (NADH-binding)